MKYNNLQEAFSELLKGPRGDQGDQGFKGSSGDIGLRGLDGPVGIQGRDGIQGPRGKQGFIGDRGDQGTKGISGSRGDRGPPGLQGPRGEKGPKGPKGIRGDQGPPGSKGAKGNKGPTGPTGQSGSQFSNINMDRGGNCYYQKVKDYNLDFLGVNSRDNNFCKSFYGMAGLKTKGWRNFVKEYDYECKCYWVGGCKCKSFVKKEHGYQYNRSYEIKCCPAVGSNISFSNNHNLDKYNKKKSVRLYPFYEP